jgi:CheY-like chemotaxis protein
MAGILVVDNSAVFRDAVAVLLRQQGFDTDVSPNGREAWASLYHHLPDLILLDLLMPERDGLQFLQLLRQCPHWGRLPVLALIGQAPAGAMVRKALDLGVSGVLTKPMDGPALLTEVCRLARRTSPRMAVA